MAEDRRLAKIMALLAQAESTSFPEEAKTFSAKAQELMTAWEIDEAQLDAARGASGIREVPAQEKVWMPGAMYAAANIQIWNVVLEANGCRLVIAKGKRYHENWKKEGYTSPYIRGTWLYLFGFEHTLTLAQMLVASLMLQMEHEYRSDAVQTQQWLEADNTGPSRVNWKNGFIFGYAAAIGDKLARARQAASKGNELVLVRRDEEVNGAVELAFPKLGKSSRSTAGQGSGSARGLGYLAGSKADIGGANRVSADSSAKALS